MDQMTAVLTASVSLSVPILLAGLGGLVSERAGVFAIGLEGYMLIGAYTAVIGSGLGGVWVGLLFGAAGGMAMALVYGVFAIRLRINQVILAVAVIILAQGLTTFLNASFLGAERYIQRVPGMNRLAIPLLSDIPVVGRALFDQWILVYFAAAASVAIWWFFRRTWSGLTLRGVGENPQASDTRGIPVIRVQYLAVLFSGFMAGLGGTVLSLGQLNAFTENITGGRGFLALAAIIFSGWRPTGVIVASFLFGAADAAQIWVNALDWSVPPELLVMFPFVLTLVVLTLFVERAPHPASLGRPYVRERR